MGCCDDPTEPVTISRVDVARAQELYGNLVRDLLTGDPERLMLSELNRANVYLRELAALNAHYDSVRKQAIQLLDKESLTVLETIVEREAGSEIGKVAQIKQEALEQEGGFLSGLLHKSK